MKYIEVVKAVREEQMKKEASVKELASLIGMKKKAADETAAISDKENKNYIRTINKVPDNVVKGNLGLNVIGLEKGRPLPQSINENDTLAKVRSNQAGTQAFRIVKSFKDKQFQPLKSLLQDIGKAKQTLTPAQLQELQETPRAQYFQKFDSIIKNPELKKNIKNWSNNSQFLDAMRYQANANPKDMTSLS